LSPFSTVYGIMETGLPPVVVGLDVAVVTSGTGESVLTGAVLKSTFGGPLGAAGFGAGTGVGF